MPVPTHWSARRPAKRGIEKPPFELPDFIKATGIDKIRQAYGDKEAEKGLKAKTRDRRAPKMGAMDIDYAVLHDAFFKYQTKPPLETFGDVYFEGKEFDAQLTNKRPGSCLPSSWPRWAWPSPAAMAHKHAAPRHAAQLPAAEDTRCLRRCRRARSTATTLAGGQAAGRRARDAALRRRVRHCGRRGRARHRGAGRQDLALGRPAYRLDSESESESEDDSDEEKEEDDAGGLTEDQIAAGTASGIASSVAAGLETPDVLDLRKKAAPQQLYTVLEQREASVAAR